MWCRMVERSLLVAVSVVTQVGVGGDQNRGVVDEARVYFPVIPACVPNT